MITIANYGLVILGLIPIIVSSIKVEKYYTNYYTGLWNIYGSILVILGFILDENVNYIILILGLFFIIILLGIGLYSKSVNNPGLIRFFGKGTIQISIVVFFLVLFITNLILISILIAVLAFWLFFSTSKLEKIGKNFGPSKYHINKYGSSQYNRRSSTRGKSNNFYFYLFSIILVDLLVIILIIFFNTNDLLLVEKISAILTVILLNVIPVYFINKYVRFVPFLNKKKKKKYYSRSPF